MRLFATLSIAVISLFGCKEPTDPQIPKDSLGFLIESKDQNTVVHELIACAAGGQNEFFQDPNFPISIFFLPEGEVNNISYWETNSSVKELSSSTDYSQRYASYLKVNLQREPVFNGKLERFLRSPAVEPTSGIVSYERNDSFFFSQPINLKASSRPTELNLELLSIDLSTSLAPAFEWEVGQFDENAIYFQVISDSTGNMVSGTYTYDRFYQFYNLDNVVLNIHDVTPTPTLISGNKYNFTLMAVSLDNWVNLIIEKEFTAQ